MENLLRHKFHIPVMGLAYTIDSPIKVARYGISSVISIVEDRLIEMMRSHYYPAINQVYYPISTREDDYRAKRITDYLNLVNTIVKEQIEKLRQRREAACQGHLGPAPAGNPCYLCLVRFHKLARVS